MKIYQNKKTHERVTALLYKGVNKGKKAIDFLKEADCLVDLIEYDAKTKNLLIPWDDNKMKKVREKEDYIVIGFNLDYDVIEKLKFEKEYVKVKEEKNEPFSFENIGKKVYTRKEWKGKMFVKKICGSLCLVDENMEKIASGYAPRESELIKKDWIEVK